MNLYYNSSIDCNEKNKNKLYDLYNTILLNKFVHYDINRSFYYYNILDRVVFRVLLLVHFRSSVFRVLSSNKIVGKGWVKST